MARGQGIEVSKREEKWLEPQAVKASVNYIESDRDTPQVEMVINQLRQTADMLEEAAGRLEERLRPILANINPMLQEAKVAVKGPELVVLASVIEQQQIRFAVVCNRLVGMLQRLEI